jgi:oligopeptide/dipeptide ABC transporter ATP-binding protein
MAPMAAAHDSATMVLEVEDLSVELSIGGRWVRALNNVSLGIRAGEALGLVGESGSGKSLTALAVAGLLPDNARVVGGSIRLGGEAVLGRSEAELNRLRGRALAFIFQNPTTYLNPLLTVGAQIAEVFEVAPELLETGLLAPEGGGRLSRRERRQRAWRLVVDHLRLVHISDPERVARQYPFELSGGMQQRVVIAMALIRRPSLVIADEITTALDVTVQAQILTLLAELRASIGMTLLLITHDMGIVAQLADRIAVMYSGSVVEASDVESLFNEARHPYAKALLEAVPRIDGNETTLRAIPGGMPAITDPPPGCRFHLRCPRAFAPCADIVPATVSLGDRHSVACHLYHREGTA